MERSYLTTLCLLVFHQIDAAYWQEWEMFYLPGGIQLYLVFNIIIIPVLLMGYKSVIVGSDSRFKFSYLCAGLGILTFTIHGLFLLFGHEQFTLPLSLLLIGGCLVSAAWQLVHLNVEKEKLKRGAL